jgi:hypothetical protein
VVANFEMMTRLADGTGAVLHSPDRAEAGRLAGADAFTSRRNWPEIVLRWGTPE